MSNEDLVRAIDALVARELAANEDRSQAIENIYLRIRDSGWLNHVTVGKYRCTRGCQIATAIQVEHGKTILLAARDYKYSHGMNEKRSVPAARASRTLNGDNWWPSHVYDMTRYAADWPDGVGAQIACRHFVGIVTGQQVLADTAGITPGHWGKPITLGASNR